MRKKIRKSKKLLLWSVTFIFTVGVIGMTATKTMGSTSSIPFSQNNTIRYEPKICNGATTVLIETGLDVENSVGLALNELGVVYDFYDTADFSGIDLTPYESVIVAMDGGVIEDSSIANIEAYVSGGGNLIMLGGSRYSPFVIAVDSRLLNIDVDNYDWARVSGLPHQTVVNPSHPLAFGLPASYDFSNISATFYMIRSQDAVASVAAINGDGFDSLLSKTIGAGRLSWFINSPSYIYWDNDPDYQILKTIISNALAYQPCTLDLTLTYIGRRLTMDFEIGTLQPTTLNIWFNVRSRIIPYGSVPLPPIDPPISLPIIIPRVPSLGTIGVLTTLVIPGDGIICSDWETVDTGPMTTPAPTAEDIKQLLRK